MSEPSNPRMAGVANLFSREFYRLARQRLWDGGIMVQWVHGYSLFPREYKMIVNTFGRVFPHSTLWRTIRGDYLLVGTGSPLTPDLALLQQRIAASPEVQADIASLRLTSPPDLLAFVQLDEVALARFADGAPENMIALAPDLAEARFNLGLVYEKQSRLDLAVREFETASRLKPAWTLPRMRLAQIRLGPAASAEAPHPPRNVPAAERHR